MKSIRSLVRNEAPIPYTGGGPNIQLAVTMRGNVEAQLRTYGSVSTVFAIVNRTAETTAGYKWNLYRKPKSVKQERTMISTTLRDT